MSTAAEPGPKRRPRGVWLIVVYYVLSAGWTLLSFALIASGALDLDPAQRAYFASLNRFDWFLTLTIAVLMLTASVLLFRLRREALSFFAAGFAVNLALTAIQVVRTSLVEAVGLAGMLGMLLAFLILAAVILYVRGLARRGVLT